VSNQLGLERYYVSIFVLLTVNYTHVKFSIQQGLRDETIDVNPSQWPNFIYEDGQRPEEGADLWKGLFKHPLIVKVDKLIFKQ